MTRTQAEVVVKLAENNINVAKTAKAMYMHRNTVDYNVRMIRKKTNKDPLQFYELLELLPMAREVLGDD